MELQHQDLETFLLTHKPVECEICGSKVYYVAGGEYQCRKCEHTMLDDFGKIKQYIDMFGPSPAVEIEESTGVRREVIDLFLKKGRLEIPEGSSYFIKCEKCKCSIRFGRFCPDCAKETQSTAKGIRVLLEEVGEKPKRIFNPENAAKVHFMDKRKNKND